MFQCFLKFNFSQKGRKKIIYNIVITSFIQPFVQKDLLDWHSLKIKVGVAIVAVVVVVLR